MRPAMLILSVSLLCSPAVARAEAPSDGESLFAAIDKNDLATVEKLLAASPRLAAHRDEDGISSVVRAGTTRADKRFLCTHENPLLKAVLARKPELDVFDAALVGDQQRLAALVARDPALVSAVSPLGWQPLAYAAFGGNVAAVTFLLGKGADVNARASTRFRNTPLQIALLCEEAASAKLLLERGADPNIRQNGDFVALHEAASIGRTDILQLLVDHGAELSPRNAKGETPLAVATRKGNAAAVTWLKTRGAMDDAPPSPASPAATSR